MSDDNNPTKDTLLEMEAKAWKALSAGQASDHYGKVLAEQSLMVVPGNVLERDEALKSWDEVDPWSEYDLGSGKFLQLSEDCALISYSAMANREGDETKYSAQFTSVYVKSDDDWKLAFHQQTPNPHPVPLPL